MSSKLFDCNECPGYCCAYPVIQVTRADASRLAKKLGLTVNDVIKEYTRKESPRVRSIKQSKDPILKTKTCVFLDKKTRKCTVYHARPQICRDHPGSRCEWYDRLQIEKAMAGKWGKKVILLKQMPWTIDGDYPLYDEDRVTGLLESYANNDGIMEK